MNGHSTSRGQRIRAVAMRLLIPVVMYKSSELMRFC